MRMLQGLKDLRLRNWAAFPSTPGRRCRLPSSSRKRPFDHCGFQLPALVAQGSAGSIICTPGTVRHVHHRPADSAHLQEREDARQATRAWLLEAQSGAATRHNGRCRRARSIDLNRSVTKQPYRIAPGREVEVSLIAGHSLGRRPPGWTIESAGHASWWRLGSLRSARAAGSEPVPRMRCVLVEATYGDRLHETRTMMAHAWRIVSSPSLGAESSSAVVCDWSVEEVLLLV